MQIATYISQVTGKSFESLFDLHAPLVRIEQDAEGEISIVYWDQSLTAKPPSPSDLLAAMAEPEPEMVPASVSARQFKLQLLAQDLLDEVETWLGTQPKSVQISFEYSTSFVRAEPVVGEGFAALKFTSSQIDEFFVAASKL